MSLTTQQRRYVNLIGKGIDKLKSLPWSSPEYQKLRWRIDQSLERSYEMFSGKDHDEFLDNYRKLDRNLLRVNNRHLLDDILRSVA